MYVRNLPLRTHHEALDEAHLARVRADRVRGAGVARHVGPPHAQGVEGKFLKEWGRGTLKKKKNSFLKQVNFVVVCTHVADLPHDLPGLVDGPVDDLEGDVGVLAELAHPDVPRGKSVDVWILNFRF